jgi:hypothetical protein
MTCVGRSGVDRSVSVPGHKDSCPAPSLTNGLDCHAILALDILGG